LIRVCSILENLGRYLKNLVTISKKKELPEREAELRIFAIEKIDFKIVAN